MSSIFYYEPYYNFERFLEEALQPQRSVNESQAQRRLGNDASSDTRALKPRMDLHENSEANVVTAEFELPGLKKEDVRIDYHNNRLTISGEVRTTSNERDEGGYAVRERRFGKFSRTLQLPQGVKDDGIKASMDDGVLTVIFPKASTESAPKKITIN